MVARNIKYAFTASVHFLLAAPVLAGDEIDQLFLELQAATAAQVSGLEDKIRQKWAQSGSAALDLLLAKGDAALLNDLAQAEGHYSAAIDHGPDLHQAYYQRAQARMALELWGPAIADLEIVLALEPRHFDAMALMALIFEEIGQEDRALALWDRIIMLSPESAEANDARRRLAEPQGVEI